MSTGSWLKTHRKQVITHTSIIVGFVLLTVFVAEPLFDSLDRIPGEAQLHRLDLPAEDNGIRFHFDKFETDDRSAVDLMGWAFIKGQDSDNSEVFIVLRSASRTYVFDTMVRTRPDVTQHFEELGLNLDYSGFNALLPARKMASGDYTVGIYIRKGDIEALQYTDRSITKSGGTVETGWVREGDGM